MDIDLMREFVVFSRYLNFSKAALKLNMAQPTLSSHVASMEKELGFALVQRGSKIRLTPAGKRFCADAERMVSGYSATVAKCKEIASQKSGSLIFEKPIHQGGMDKEADLLLLRFREAFPTITVHKQATQDRTLHEILESGLADVALVLNDSIELYDGTQSADIEIIPLPDRKRGPYYLWLDATHPLASKESIRIDELGGCRFLIPSSIRYQCLEKLAEAGTSLTESPVSCTYWPGSYEECIININPDEVMIVYADDRSDPAYSLGQSRVFIPLLGLEDLLKPCFALLKGNDNPAVETFTNFMRELS